MLFETAKPKSGEEDKKYSILTYIVARLRQKVNGKRRL